MAPIPCVITLLLTTVAINSKCSSTRGFAPDIERRFQSCLELTTRVRDVLAVPKDKPEDPIVLAAFFGRELQEQDRRTQLQTHKEACMTLGRSLQSAFIQSYQHKINNFEVARAGARHLRAEPFPEGFEYVGVGDSYIVAHTLHGARQIRIAFGVEGNQIVMLGQLTVAQRGVPPVVGPSVKREWKKMLWFSPDEPPPVQALLEPLVRYLNEAMKELRDAALQQTEQ
jgi:hypothetical protein